MRNLMRSMVLPGLILSGLMLSMIQPVQASPGALTVGIEGLRNRKGNVCLSVFNSSRGFPGSGENAIQSQCVKANEAGVKVTFRGLKSGSYAVAVLHDENADGQANRNGLGIPTEGFGFSRNPALRAGPPKFSEAAFLAVGARTEIQIQMTYLF